MIGTFLQGLLTLIVSIVANVVYLDMKRKGIHGFTRFAAFWTGTPVSWITFFVVREGVIPPIHPPPDDDEGALLAKIRRDRALRQGEPAEVETDGVGEREPGDGRGDVGQGSTAQDGRGIRNEGDGS